MTPDQAASRFFASAKLVADAYANGRIDDWHTAADTMMARAETFGVDQCSAAILVRGLLDQAEEERGRRSGKANGRGGVPFMITNAMKAELAARGYTPEQIAAMRPAEAHEILAVISQQPPIVDDAPPVASPDDYGIISSKAGIAQAKKPPRINWREKAITAAKLQAMTFQPVAFVVPGLIPAEGATLICSKPKVGKSWLLLDVAIGATMDRFVLGDLKPKQGDVLYLALEDSHRRLQSRMTRLLGANAEAWPPGLTLMTQWARVDLGGCEDIRAWCRETRAAGRAISFIAIDVLKIVRPPPKNGQTPYEADYDAIRSLQQLALDEGVPIVIVHHTRKAEATDLMDKVSGTYGIVGAADTIIVLDRPAAGVVLDVRGRDIEANTYAAEFNKETCRWTLLGEAAEVHQSKQRQTILAIFAEATEPLGVADVMELGLSLGLWDRGLGLPKAEAVKKLLLKMCKNGMIIRAKRGKYILKDTPSPFGPKVPNSEHDQNDED